MATKKRGAQGTGSIRQRPDGRWEARYTYQDELGATKRGSVYGATQKETARKLKAILKAVDDGAYRKEKRMTVEQWMTEWLNTYGGSWKPRTRDDYRSKAQLHIIPYFQGAQIGALTPLQIQKWVNRLSEGADGRQPLSPKTVKNIHGIFHSALKQAMLCGLIQSNPADNTRLPKLKKPELKPLMDDDIGRFLSAIQGTRFERLYIVALFTGLRRSELLGVQWEDVDFENRTLTVRRQLQRQMDGTYLYLDETKNGKSREVPLSASLVRVLKEQRAAQAQWKLAAGAAWENEHDLVFTDELGRYLHSPVVYRDFKQIVKGMGLPDVRFHDLRHSCAIIALQSGCSVKAVQEQLGHYSSAFTMDVYASVSQTMMEDTRQKMEAAYIQASDKAQ